MVVDRHTAAPTMQSPSNAALVMQTCAAPSSQCSPTNVSPAVQPNVASQVQSRQCSLTNAAPTMQPHEAQRSQPQASKTAQPHASKPAQPHASKPAQPLAAKPTQIKVAKPTHDQYVMLSSMLKVSYHNYIICFIINSILIDALLASDWKGCDII